MRALLIITALAVLAAAVTFLALSTVVPPRVSIPPSQIAALERFDYTDWAHTLETYVDGDGRVDYPALKANRGRLDRFIALIAAAGPETTPRLFTTRAEKLAYYINAYNALVLFNVINRYPAFGSVYDNAKDFFYFTEFVLDGDEIDLYSLENSIVRPDFDEPRAHFALNCASAGCPALPAEPFLPATLEAQLERESQKFLHEARNVEVAGEVLTLSQIFEWYAEDFRPSPAAWISAEAPDLRVPAKAVVRHRPYDWTLNDQRR